MFLIRTSWDKGKKREAIKCLGRKQSKGIKSEAQVELPIGLLIRVITWIYTMKNNMMLFFWHDVIFFTS